MNQLPANTGWLWVKQGYHYFKQQPLEFSTLFLGYLFFTLILGLIPFIGSIISFVLLPLFTLSFMQGCKEIDQGTQSVQDVRIHPRLLLYGFQSPQVAKLIQLGLLYLITAIIALAASTFIDDGVFWQVISGQMELTVSNIEDTNIAAAMLFSMVLYIPALMAFWFAGPLIAWQQMSLLKAIFCSFVATYRVTRAFVVYGLSWFAVGGLLPAFFSVILAISTGNNPIMIIFIMTPFSMMLTIIFYCSFYPAYQSVFDPTASVESSTIS